MENSGFTELSDIKKENPFRVPGHYFDDFTARLQYRIESESTSAAPQEKNSVIRLLKPILGIAASFALVFLLVYWPVKFINNSSLVDNNSEGTTSQHELINYVEGVDENSFYALFSEPTVKTEITEDDVVSYMNNNLSDYEIYSGYENNN